MVTVTLRDRGLIPVSGQVLAADDDWITLYEPAAGGSGSGYVEELPVAAIASIERHGSAPLTVTHRRCTSTR
jgi:hypothetical protein